MEKNYDWRSKTNEFTWFFMRISEKICFEFLNHLADPSPTAWTKKPPGITIRGLF
jgi:hypothetical protein